MLIWHRHSKTRKLQYQLIHLPQLHLLWKRSQNCTNPHSTPLLNLKRLAMSVWSRCSRRSRHNSLSLQTEPEQVLFRPSRRKWLYRNAHHWCLHESHTWNVGYEPFWHWIPDSENRRGRLVNTGSRTKYKNHTSSSGEKNEQAQQTTQMRISGPKEQCSFHKRDPIAMLEARAPFLTLLRSHTMQPMDLVPVTILVSPPGKQRALKPQNLKQHTITCCREYSFRLMGYKKLH